MTMVVWSNWERERERERERSETKRWVKPILFLFKFLTSQVSFYGLVNVEPELKPKVEFLTLTNPHSTCLGIRVGWVWRVDGQPYFIYIYIYIYIVLSSILCIIFPQKKKCYFSLPLSLFLSQFFGGFCFFIFLTSLL